MLHGLKPTAAAICLAAAVFISPTLLAAAPAQQDALVDREQSTLFVYGEGDDSATGTRHAPLRTISAALAKAHAMGGSVQVRISVGTYDAEAGETFPLDLTGGVSLMGIGSGIAVIDAGDAPLALRLGMEAEGRALLAGLSVRGTGIGLALGAGLDNEQGTGHSARDMVLRDVLFEGLNTGIALDLGSEEVPQPITLRANGLRTRDTQFGLRVLGEGHLVLTLVDSSLENGVVGLVLENDPEEDTNEPRANDEEGVARVHHDIRLLRTRVTGMTRAGVLRVGRDGRNRGGPYLFDDCTFDNNLIGVEFRRPCLDAEVRFTGTSFLANQQFGLRLTGGLGAQDATPSQNLIEGCIFRWNGVGAHITSSVIPLVIRRSRFLDNKGNGLFVSNFLTDPTEVLIESSLFAGNGSHGIYSLADSRLQSVSILNCTVVDNDAGGIRDHRRHAGTSQFRLVGCIVVGNGDHNDLVDIVPELASHCLIGGVKGLEPGEVAASFGDRGNLLGQDPRFVDRAAGDFALQADSPCLSAVAGEALAGLPGLDLWGRSFSAEGQARPMGCFKELLSRDG